MKVDRREFIKRISLAVGGLCAGLVLSKTNNVDKIIKPESWNSLVSTEEGEFIATSGHRIFTTKNARIDWEEI